ncbi:MAG TPA: hypothetical protein VF765_37095 [Polyangiaceae bacterium]
MMKLGALIGSCAALALGAGTGCEELPPAEVAVSPQMMAEVPAYAQGEAAGTGQWVWTAQYGWVWVPAETAPLAVQGEPYVYLYTPTYGWTWFDSPWGWYGPGGGWGWARPWYGSDWGPRYHAYTSPGVNVAPPAYRVAPRATNVAPPAYRVAPGAMNVAPPAYRGASRGFNAAPVYRAPSRAMNVAPPAYRMAPPRTLAVPHVGVRPGGGFHGGRR